MKTSLSKEAYEQQIKRLVSVFGGNQYSPERIKLFWNQEIRFWSEETLAKTIDNVISSCRSAPLLEELRNERAKIREADRQKEKRQNKESAERFLDDETSAFYMKEIKRRLRGEMPDNEWEQFKSMVYSTCGKPSDVSCPRCEDRGIIVRQQNGMDYAYRCSCSAGLNRPEKYPVFH